MSLQMPLRGLTPLLAVVLLSVAPPIHAQVRGSERATVSQRSDGTTVVIDYARPRVRGRSPVFPDLIEWGHVWTPGANSATTIEADRDIEVDGTTVPAGRYSVWLIPASGEWELVLDPNDRLYHTQPPQPSPDQIRMMVTPEATDFTEALTWEFPDVDPEGMALRFRWDEVRIDLRIDVESTVVADAPAEEAAAIAGSYEMSMAGPPPEGVDPAMMPPSIPVTITYEDGRLIGSTFMGPGDPVEFELFPRAEWIYIPGWMMDGEVFEMELEIFFEFAVEDGVVTGFDMRGVVDDRIDRLMSTAERVR
jgi:hypothetical protein